MRLLNPVFLVSSDRLNCILFRVWTLLWWPAQFQKRIQNDTHWTDLHSWGGGWTPPVTTRHASSTVCIFGNLNNFESVWRYLLSCRICVGICCLAIYVLQYRSINYGPDCLHPHRLSILVPSTARWMESLSVYSTTIWLVSMMSFHQYWPYQTDHMTLISSPSIVYECVVYCN